MELKRLEKEDLEIILNTLKDFTDREAPLEKRLEWDKQDVCPEPVVRAMLSGDVGLHLCFIERLISTSEEKAIGPAYQPPLRPPTHRPARPRLRMIPDFTAKQRAIKRLHAPNVPERDLTNTA